jgi:hypothetical protein
MAISIILSGSLNGFHYLHDVNLQLHDGYIEIPLWTVNTFVFIVLTVIIFLFLSIKSKFQHLPSLRILLLHNTLTIGVVLYLFYLAYSIIAMDAFVELFRNTKSEELLVEQFNKVILFFSSAILFLIAGEIFLIHRINALRINVQDTNQL